MDIVGPAVLRSRLMSELKVNLEPREIDILIAKFDEKGTGLINISEYSLNTYQS